MFLKKMLLGSAAALAFAAATPAAATCVYMCSGPAVVFSNANAGGFAGTAMNGRISDTDATQLAKVNTRADTSPPFALGTAYLHQETSGWAAGRNISGDLYMDGNTSAGAQVGRYGEGAETATMGEGSMYGVTQGRRAIVIGGLHGASEQHSSAVDTRWGGDSDADAEQVVTGAVFGTASDRRLASVQVGVSASAQASESP